MATSNHQANDTTDSLADSASAEAQTTLVSPQNPAQQNGDKAPADGGVSKNAAKKAAKKEKLAAGKSDKANNQGGAKSEKKPAASKASKKKIEGAALVGIDVAKEDDFSEWYNQVLRKGDMMANYELSGCYILKVIFPR